MEPSSSVEGDIEPHINIGSSYQAIIPPCCTEPGKVNKEEEKGDLLWSPIIEERHCSRWEGEGESHRICAKTYRSGFDIQNKAFTKTLLQPLRKILFIFLIAHFM